MGWLPVAGEDVLHSMHSTGTHMSSPSAASEQSQSSLTTACIGSRCSPVQPSFMCGSAMSRRLHRLAQHRSATAKLANALGLCALGGLPPASASGACNAGPAPLQDMRRGTMQHGTHAPSKTGRDLS